MLSRPSVSSILSCWLNTVFPVGLPLARRQVESHEVFVVFIVIITLVQKFSQRQKEIFFLGLDTVLAPVAIVFAFAVQTPSIPPVQALLMTGGALPYLMGLVALVSVLTGTYRMRLSAYEIKGIARSAVMAASLSMGSAVGMYVAGPALLPGFYVVLGLVYFVMAAGLRLILFQVLLTLYRLARPRCRVLIYGAGSTGVQLVRALSSHGQIVPVAFVDDNTTLQGLTVAGLTVYSPVNIGKIVKDRSIDRVLLALPSLSPPKQAQIARRLQKMGLEVQTLPSFAQLIGEEALADKLQPVPAHSFLNRAEIREAGSDQMAVYAGKTVLVSGAGGSVGSELCRQVLLCRPAKLVLYDWSELALYTLEMELRAAGHTVIVPVMGSVTDSRQVRQVLAAHNVQVVLHAAAYKHVPLVEENPLAGLSNNVLGTHTLAQLSAEAGVERFILISSDKAVRPVGVMGASKRLAELVVQDMARRVCADTGPIYSMVRFGNVLGSSGSVVPLFQEQLQRGGPITVTHPYITRYFMTIQEAIGLVLQAGAMATGGEVFVLDMGAPVPIMRLARQIITAAGYSVQDADTPEGDIQIEITGLRPGEKLHEELLISQDTTRTAHPKIFCAREDCLSEIEVASLLHGLRQAMATGNVTMALAVVARWVEMSPSPLSEYAQTPLSAVEGSWAIALEGTNVV
jgi:FlaA1/EpsC-like NDP-sugar epimerase